MTAVIVIENKISAAKKYLKILERYKKYTQEELISNIDSRGAVERYLYLVIQATIDLAEAVIAYKNFRKPVTMSETYDILREENIISVTLTEKLTRMVGFRNIIAHDYENINYDIVYSVLHRNLNDIKNCFKINSLKI
ncbi:MAG: DUF86 domain-containing protein [Parcubacteria group bacterium]|nr:DUF86 domain-containing protein [Parcubacteria group bacterium]